MWKTILFIVALLIAIALLLTGCNETAKNAREQARNACIKQGGIPIISDFNRLEDCLFPPSKIQPIYDNTRN